jgi:hypothetical protein
MTPSDSSGAIGRIEHFMHRGHRHKAQHVKRGDWYRRECSCGLVKWRGEWLALDRDQGWTPIPPDVGDW